MRNTDYNQQAKDLLNKLGIDFKIEFMKHDFHFADDKEKRDIYNVFLVRGNRSMKIVFGQSLNKSGFKLITGAKKTINVPTGDTERKLLLTNRQALKMLIERTIKFNLVNSDTLVKPEEPTEYDILACLTKYDPGTLEDFCNEFGYDFDSKKTEKIYNAVKEEYLNVCALFSDTEMEELSEIQ